MRSSLKMAIHLRMVDFTKQKADEIIRRKYKSKIHVMNGVHMNLTTVKRKVRSGHFCFLLP
jgi:hypothetical protein